MSELIDIKKKISKTEIVYDGIDTNIVIEDNDDNNSNSQNSLKNRTIRYSLFDKLNTQKKQLNSRVLDVLNANDEKEKGKLNTCDIDSRRRLSFDSSKSQSQNNVNISNDDSKLKEKFLLQIENEYKLTTIFKNKDFKLIGLPLYNETISKTIFDKKVKVE